MPSSSEEIAKYIDHSILKPNTTVGEVEKQLDVAIKYNVASVCIMPHYLPVAVKRLSKTTVVPSTVVGFPHGYDTYIDKIFCVRNAIHHGAKEIDYVVNIGLVMDEDWDAVRHEIQTLVHDCHSRSVKVKVIFENCYLNDKQKIMLTHMCSLIGVDWVKTSTGFGKSGATLEDVILMRKHVAGKTEVKAAGGIRDFKTMLTFIDAGVTRCGCSTTEAVMEQAREFYGV